VSADSGTIPSLTLVQLNHFVTELFKVVPRRLLPTRQNRPGRPQTTGERLTMLSMVHGSWKRAAAIVLGEAVEGCRNDIAWSVIASAAGRGIPEDIVWELFERHFCGWDGVSESQIASMMERTRPVRQSSPMIFVAPASTGASMPSEDEPDATSGPGADNVIPFKRVFDAPKSNGRERDDDELVRTANKKIAEWKTTSGSPGLTQVQELFYASICAGASAMARDKIVAAVVAAFGEQLGGKRALGATWNEIGRQFKADCAHAAREKRDDTAQAALTPNEKQALRDALWPKVRELAQAPDLMDRVVQQVQARGVVNERELIVLIYIAATSRVLDHPLNVLAKGASSSGKSFTTTNTLELIGPDVVNHLTSSSALSLVYDDRPLAHTILFINEANQLQADENSTFAMLVRSLVSEGRIVHQTTVEDGDSPTGRRVERIVREGPISLILTTTGELHAENETRMLSFQINESHDQTRAVIANLASRATGTAAHRDNLSIWHELQQWVALGPDDAVVPFAPQITAGIPPLMVRFRRDVSSLFSFIKASAILHQAQRQVDAQGRVVASVADYALAYSIFTTVMAQSSGRSVPDNVREVVKLVAERASSLPTKPTKGKFQRTATVGPGSEVVISNEQIGTATGIGKSAAYRAICTALDLGFLANNETRPGKPFRLTLKQGLDEAGPPVLPDPKTIAQECGAA
jgi:hypothetical protein